MDLALNNRQWLICHKTKLNQTKPICINEPILSFRLFSLCVTTDIRLVILDFGEWGRN